MVPDDHPVSSFMDQYYINLHHKDMTVAQNLRAIFQTHTQIWNDESHMKIVIDTLIHIGANMLLSNNDRYDIANALCVAQSIVALEHYNDTCDIDLVLSKRVVASKHRDLNITGSSRRDALKFYRKRTTCKCLKKMHLEARKTHKFGLCFHCNVEQERVALSLCSRCMVIQYCSRECQVAAWPGHERLCNAYVRIYEEDLHNLGESG